MSDPSVEDLWAGLDSFESEFKALEDPSNATQTTEASTLNRIDDLLRLVQQQENSWDSLPSPSSTQEAEVIKPIVPNSNLTVTPAVQQTVNLPSLSTLSPTSTPSPTQPESTSEKSISLTHEEEVSLVRDLLISARGDSITDTQRSAIDKLLSLSKPDSDDLSELIQLSTEIKKRAEYNRGAPKLLLDQQARLDADNILALERKLAEKLVPKEEPSLPPTPIIVSNISEEEKKRRLMEIEDLEAQMQSLNEPNKSFTTASSDFFNALSELESRSAIIQQIASGKLPISEIASFDDAHSNDRQSDDVPQHVEEPTVTVPESEPLPSEKEETLTKEYESKLKMLQEEHIRKEREQNELIEQAKIQALEKARQEYQEQLERDRKEQEARIEALKLKQEEERLANEAQLATQEAKMQELQRRQSVIDPEVLEEMKRQAIELAKKDLLAQKESMDQKQRIEEEQRRAEMEAKIAAEREAQRQSQLIVEEAFKAKMIAEARAAKEEAARRELEEKLLNDEKEKEALLAQLKNGEQAQRLLQARIEMEAKQLHEEYLARIQAAEADEKQRAEAEAEEKARLKEQLMKMKADSERIARENEEAIKLSKEHLERLQTQQSETERQLQDAKAKAEAMEGAKQRAVQIFTSIEAEHDHISGQFEATLKQAEEDARQERAKQHNIVQVESESVQISPSATEDTMSKMVAAEKAKLLEQASIEREAVLAAEREAINYAKLRAHEERLRLEKATEQIRAKASNVEEQETAMSALSPRKSNQSELFTATAVPISAVRSRALSVIPNRPVAVEKKSSHTFNSSAKESTRPSDHILSYYQPIAPVSAMPDSVPIKPVVLTPPLSTSPSAFGTARSSSRRTIQQQSIIGLRRESTGRLSPSPTSSPTGSVGEQNASAKPTIQITTKTEVAGSPTISTSSSETAEASVSPTPSIFPEPTPSTQEPNPQQSKPSLSELDEIIAAVGDPLQQNESPPTQPPSTGTKDSTSTIAELEALLGSSGRPGRPHPSSMNTSQNNSSSRPKISLSEIDDLISGNIKSLSTITSQLPVDVGTLIQTQGQAPLPPSSTTQPPLDIDALIQSQGQAPLPPSSTAQPPLDINALIQSQGQAPLPPSSTTQPPLDIDALIQSQGQAPLPPSDSKMTPPDTMQKSQSGTNLASSKANKVLIHVTLPSLKNQTFECVVDSNQTIASLKLFMWVEVFQVQRVPVTGTHMDYVFRAEDDDYFSDEKVKLCDTPYYIECMKGDITFDIPNQLSSHQNRARAASSIKPTRVSPCDLVKIGAANTIAGMAGVKGLSHPIQLFWVSKQEIAKVNEQIESMIGSKLCMTEEALAFRKEMHHVVSRAMAISYRRVRVPQLNPFDNVEDYLPAQYNIHVWFWNEVSKEAHQKTTVTSKLHDTANMIIQRILDDHPYRFADYSENYGDYILKVRGIDEWVWDTIEVISLETVRNCLRKRRLVELVVYPRDDVPSHIAQILQKYDADQMQKNDGKDRQALEKQRNPLDLIRSSVAMGFDLSTVFQTEEKVPSSWYKSWDLTDKHLTVKIRSLEHIPFDANLFKLPKKRDALTHIFIACSVIYPGGSPSGSNIPFSTVGQSARTLPELYLEESLETINIRADLFLPFFSQIPRASKLRFEVVVRYKETEQVVAWAEQPVFSYNSIVKTGLFSVQCNLGNSSSCLLPWSTSIFAPNVAGNSNVSSPGPSSPSQQTSPTQGQPPSESNEPAKLEHNLTNQNLGPQLVFEVVALDQPVVYPSKFTQYENHPNLANLDPQEPVPNPVNLNVMNTSLNTLLHRPSRQEQAIFWKHRGWCQKNAKSLDLFLASIPWSKLGALQQAYLMLKGWQSPVQPLDVIQILNKNHLEPRFREHAVSVLHRLSDSELAEVLLQLVQALKHEITHDSALARFLLIRALFNQNQIGHYFYWHLKACLQMPVYRDRFSLVLEVYLRYSSHFRTELFVQTQIYNRLISIAGELKTIKEPAKRVPFLHEKLNQIAQSTANSNSTNSFSMPSSFQLPINCNMIASRFNIPKCKNLDSKTLPLWLACDSADPLGDTLYAIMKVGDDLRQDQLTLQMFGIMDKLWLAHGLDLKMSAYRVIETGSECGMIEVVPNAMTNASIQKQYGGVTAAFSDKPLSEWLQKNNPNEHDYNAAVRDFVSSCAGYCVATYVLGIGDRHNDNIMITKTGHLFHIDFGRFLGNSEKFAGVSRDRAPFVLTPEFAYVMGGHGSPLFQRFTQLCCTAYNIIRKHAGLFTSLFAMMLQTGIPELRSEDDIRYLSDAFSLELTDEEASKKFEGLIKQSLETTATRLNFAIHIWANPEK